ncbi:hypothetical protein AYO71_06485 [Pseudomonas koreensis]|nr:hypothetical protein AYO71_06485 [Pseudomonas koreensis]
MPAGQAEVIGKHMTIQLFAQLSTNNTTAHASGQSAEDGARDCTERDGKWIGNATDRRDSAGCSERGADALCCASDGAENGTDPHGCFMESDVLRVTERAPK